MLTAVREIGRVFAFGIGPDTDLQQPGSWWPGNKKSQEPSHSAANGRNAPPPHTTSFPLHAPQGPHLLMSLFCVTRALMVQRDW